MTWCVPRSPGRGPGSWGYQGRHCNYSFHATECRTRPASSSMTPPRPPRTHGGPVSLPRTKHTKGDPRLAGLPCGSDGDMLCRVGLRNTKRHGTTGQEHPLKPRRSRSSAGPSDPGPASIALGRAASPLQGSWLASDPHAANPQGAGPSEDCSEVRLLRAEQDPGLPCFCGRGTSVIRIWCMPVPGRNPPFY